MYSLPPPSGRLQHIFIEVQSYQAFPLLRTRQRKVYYFIYTVINGPVKLLGLVTGQDQHESVGRNQSCVKNPKRNDFSTNFRLWAKDWRLLVALFSRAIQEGIEGGSEVFTDLLLKNRVHLNSWLSNGCTAEGWIQKCTGLQWISSEGMHPLRQRKAGAWNGKDNHLLVVTGTYLLSSNFTPKTFKATVTSLPVSTRVRPVEHFVHGCHTVAAHWRNVTTGHNGVIHPRMYCQLLLDAEKNCQRERKTSLSSFRSNSVWWHALP